MPAKRKRTQPPAKGIWLDHPAPVTLIVFLLALFAFLLSGSGQAPFYRDWFSLEKTSFADPAQYLRMFGFVLGSGSLASFLSSWILFLLVAPGVEQPIGSGKTAVLFVATAGITGLLGLLLGAQGLMGNQCLVLTLLVLTAVFRLQEGRIPLFSGLVLALYVWGKVASFQGAGQIIHELIPLGGAVVGILLGLLLGRKKK